MSGESGNAGGVFIGSEDDTNQLIVAEDAVIEASSTSGDAGNIDLSGAGIYFQGQLQARGGASQAQLNIHSGEALEYSGLADLRAYGNEDRFGTVNIDSRYANLSIAPTGSAHPGILDSDALTANTVVTGAGATSGAFNPAGLPALPTPQLFAPPSPIKDVPWLSPAIAPAAVLMGTTPQVFQLPHNVVQVPPPFPPAVKIGMYGTGIQVQGGR